MFIAILIICCSPSKKNNCFDASNLKNIAINDSTELVIHMPIEIGKLPYLIFYSNSKKDSLYVGTINANLECRPQNLVYSNTTTLINTNYFKFNKYFVYIIASEEPFPTNSICLFDMNKNQLISPVNKILNRSDNIDNLNIFHTGPFSRIDTTNCKIETIIRIAPADLLFYSWDFKNNKLDSLLINNKWTDISLDSLASLNRICNVFESYLLSSEM